MEPEGLTNEDVYARLKGLYDLAGDSNLQVGGDAICRFLKPILTSLEIIEEEYEGETSE